MELIEQARRIFSQDHFAHLTTGATIETVGLNTATCHLRIEERHCNARSVAMGGSLYTLADFAAAIAANTETISTGDQLYWVSLDATIHYLSPHPIGTIAEAQCTPVKVGRSTALYRTTITDLSTRRTTAVVETTMIRMS